jgi:hypothetical protein
MMIDDALLLGDRCSSWLFVVLLRRTRRLDVSNESGGLGELAFQTATF